MMSRLIAFTLLILSSTAFAQSFPDYYPKEGFNRTAVVDAVYPDELLIVLGDREFRMNSRPIVRSLSSRYDSMARVRPGSRVAFRLDENGEIVEIWLLPKDYVERRSR
jgi:hypothetical protein